MNRRGFLKNTAAGTGLGLVALGHEMWAAAPSHGLKTRHTIVLINGNGARKLEYYERPEIASNFLRLAKEGTVFTEDHGNHVSNHGYMYTEYLTGMDIASDQPMLPTFLHYGRKANGDETTKYWYVNPVAYYRQWRFNNKYFTSHPDFGLDTRSASINAQNIFFEGNKLTPSQIVEKEFPKDMGLTATERKRVEDFIAGVMQKKSYLPTLRNPLPPRTPMMEEGHALALVPLILQEFKPRMIVIQQVAHDTGHGAGGYLRDETGYLEYVSVAKSTNELVGQLLDFIKADPYFSTNTAIVVRPETGRDDEVNLYGEIHHSDGYYYAHRPASIWWGPDFKKDVVIDQVVNRMDMCPTLAFMLGADKTLAKGSVRPQVFAGHVTDLPQYRDISYY